MAALLRPQDAWAAIERHLAPLSAVSLARRSAAGRVLSSALNATVDVPAADVSAMDGYALAGPIAVGASLSVSAMLAAGSAPGVTLLAGTAARIMTGAPLPKHADRVIPVELSDRGEQHVVFTQDLPAGANIRQRGEVLRRGDPLFAAGALLTPGALALLATHGIDPVPVFGVPRVAVLATGDEVVPASQMPVGGELRDSHTDFLLAAGQQLRLDFEPLGIARDRAEDLVPLLASGLERDVLLVCGGVSMGDFDLVAASLVSLGCEILFHGVNLQPGKPLLVARHRRGWVCGLPGNPASVQVTYWLFVRPLLRRLQGLDDGYWAGSLRATLAAPLPAGGERERFLAARLRFADGRVHATPVLPRGSHDLAAYGRGTALVRCAAVACGAGEECEVLPL
jgi:molybdopterin molybdotransferase